MGRGYHLQSIQDQTDAGGRRSRMPDHFRPGDVCSPGSGTNQDLDRPGTSQRLYDGGGRGETQGKRPDVIEIRSLSQLTAQVTIPGSKSNTQRAMIMAALAEGESHLPGPLLSEDTQYLADALRLLGADIEVHGGDMSVQGTSGRIQNPQKETYLGK